MADIASSDVTYTHLNKSIGESGLAERNLTVAFGNGALTYPAGGVPLLAASLGCPNAIKSLLISDDASANGLVYKYDAANNKIRIYEVDGADAGDGPLVELDSGSDAPAAATLYVNVKGY